jgi:YcxB-like protein
MAHSYELTYRDFIDAQRLHRKQRTFAQVSFIFWIFVMPAISFGMVIWVFWIYISGERALFFQLLPIAAWLGAVSIIVLGMRPYTLRKIYRRSLPEGVKGAIPVNFSFGEEGVLSAIPGRSEGKFFWNSIVNYAENDKLALLYVKKKLFLYIPKRAMPEDEWQQLRAYVHAKTGKI